MARLVGSFLIRLWSTARSERIEIEHIQSGEKGLVSTITDAADWIRSRAGDEPSAPLRATNEPPDRVDDSVTDATNVGPR